MATQLVLYANDAVDATYADGSRLQLSACGAAFVHLQPLDGSPLLGEKKIHQRTQFTTSIFKEKVVEALDFRNRFALRPYICSNLVEPSSFVRLHADVFEIAWQKTLKQAEIEHLPDGSVRLTSADDFATISLAPSRQHFNVCYLGKVGQTASKQRWSSIQNKSERFVGTDNNNPRHELVQQPLSVSDAPNPKASQSKEDNRNVIDMSQTASQRHSLRSVGNQKESVGADDKGGGTSIDSVNTICENSAGAKPLKNQSNVVDILSENRWDYTWVTQYFSVAECPEWCKLPITILGQIKISCNGGRIPLKDFKNLQNTLEETSEKDQVCSFRNAGKKRSEISIGSETVMSKQKLSASCVFASLPKTLPLNCTATHLHKWRPDVLSTGNSSDESVYMQAKVKVICSQGVIYRMNWEHPRGVEIYPGDGTVLKSTGVTGQYFKHYVPDADKVEERTYSLNYLPPHTPGIAYSIAKLVTKGVRFLQHLSDDNLQLLAQEDRCCWKSDGQPLQIYEPPATVMLEECTVENVGKFCAYSNGRVRITFIDRTCLEMVADFNKRVSGSTQQIALGESNVTTISQHARYKDQPYPKDLNLGVCKLLLPNGHYHVVDIANPAGYQRYIQSALEWVNWVKSTADERCHFYKGTIHDADQWHSVNRELKKINCFNYIIEHTVLPQFQHNQEQIKPLDIPEYRLPVPYSERQDDNIQTSERTTPPNLPPNIKSKVSVTRQAGFTDLPAVSTQSPGEEGINLQFVQEILKKTSDTILDLDQFLANNGES